MNEGIASGRVTLRRLQGLQFSAESGTGYRITLDAGEAAGGANVGMRATEAMRIALGACSAMAVASILAKMRQRVSAYEVTVEAAQADEHPRVFLSIEVAHRFEGDIAEERVRRAILLSGPYCPIHDMLGKSVAIVDRFEIWRGGEPLAAGAVEE